MELHTEASVAQRQLMDGTTVRGGPNERQKEVSYVYLNAKTFRSPSFLISCAALVDNSPVASLKCFCYLIDGLYLSKGPTQSKKLAYLLFCATSLYVQSILEVGFTQFHQIFCLRRRYPGPIGLDVEHQPGVLDHGY